MEEHPTPWPDIFYRHNMLHRNENRRKSQWTISYLDERKCFEHGALPLITQLIILKENDKCWGLHIVDGRVCYLGRVAPEKEDNSQLLFIAKFVDGDKNGKWHGYPANHMSEQQDIPHPDILSYWRNEDLLTFAQTRKIGKGQRCKL